MRDLSAQDFLQEILAAGVSSFKIEGRMKRPEYVAVVTRGVSQSLGQHSGNREYKPEKAAAQELEQIFNRGGFTKGYYYGTDHKTLYSKEKPNNWGVFLGRVQKLDKKDWGVDFSGRRFGSQRWNRILDTKKWK